MGPRLLQLTQHRFSSYSMCSTWTCFHTLLQCKCKRESKQTCCMLRIFNACMTKYAWWWGLICEIRRGELCGKMREERKKGKGGKAKGCGVWWRVVAPFSNINTDGNHFSSQQDDWSTFCLSRASMEACMAHRSQLMMWLGYWLKCNSYFEEMAQNTEEMPDICWSQPLLNEKTCYFSLVCIIANWISLGLD